MKKFCLLFLSACLVFGGTAIAGDDVCSEFENCGICSSMCEIDGVFERVTCEMKAIDNGMISVSVVPDDLKSEMEAAHQKMEQAIAKMMGGEQMELCGFCKSMGKLAAAGAKIEKYELDAAYVMLITSDDPETVELIHAHAKMAMDMKEKMEQHMKTGTSVSQR